MLWSEDAEDILGKSNTQYKMREMNEPGGLGQLGRTPSDIYIT
jgi:hypothetical protein